MNSKERVWSAMNHQEPDRVPVMCQLALGHYFLNCDYSPSQIWFDSQTFAHALVDLQRRYGFDGVLVNIPGRPPDWQSKLQSKERVGESECLRWKSGLETVMPPDDNPQTYQSPRAPLQRQDYKNIDIARAATYRLPGYIWNTWHAPELWDIDPQADLSDSNAYPEWFTTTLKTVQRLAPDISVHAEVFSPFTHLMELFGYEQALLALVDEPEKCHRLLAVLTRNVLAQVLLYGRCGPDAILVSSAFAGAGFISRQMYKEFVAPYEDQVFRAIHQHGSGTPAPPARGQACPCESRGGNVKAYVHTCGAIADRLDLMGETCVDGIDTLDPPPLGTVDLAEAKSKYGERFFFKGNLDAVNEMLNADDQTFEQAVKDRISIGKPGSGYILSSACSVAPHVKPARLKRLKEFAEKFGRYGG